VLVQVEACRKRDAKTAAQRRKNRAEFDAWVNELEQRVTQEDLHLAEGLDELATQIERMPVAVSDEGDDHRAALQPWTGWLKNKADRVRHSSKARQET
jgi:hypothetical protein